MDEQHEPTPANSPDKASQDRPGPARTGQDRRVTVDEAAIIFEREGLPRSKRAIRRYCQRGKLDCKPIETTNGHEQHSISVDDIRRFVGEQHQLYAVFAGRPGSDKPGQSRTKPGTASAPPHPARDRGRLEMQVHGLGVGARQDQRRALAALGTDGAEQMAPKR